MQKRDTGICAQCGALGEALALLVALPLVIVWVRARFYLPLLPVLLTGALYTFWRSSSRVDFRKAFSRPAPGWWKPLVLRGSVVAVFSVAFCLSSQPESFADFPRHRPFVWLMVLCLYPVLSVLPQEIIYRFYFFEVIVRDSKNKWLCITLGALLFSWVHIIYSNAFAMWGTLIAGGIFNWIYWEYRAQPGVGWRLVAEHSAYGLIIFTVGLGSFFFLAI